MKSDRVRNTNMHTSCGHCDDFLQHTLKATWQHPETFLDHWLKTSWRKREWSRGMQHCNTETNPVVENCCLFSTSCFWLPFVSLHHHLLLPHLLLVFLFLPPQTVNHTTVGDLYHSLWRKLQEEEASHYSLFMSSNRSTEYSCSTASKSQHVDIIHCLAHQQHSDEGAHGRSHGHYEE